jgi:hypothetical protein
MADDCLGMNDKPASPRKIAQATGLPSDVARFIHAIEAGKIDGDCVEFVQAVTSSRNDPDSSDQGQS